MHGTFTMFSFFLLFSFFLDSGVLQDEHCGSDISASDTQVELGSVYQPSCLDVDNSILSQSVHRPWSIDVDHPQHDQSVHQSTCIGVDHVMHDLHSSGSQLVATSVPDPLQGQILLDSNDETLSQGELNRRY